MRHAGASSVLSTQSNPALSAPVCVQKCRIQSLFWVTGVGHSKCPPRTKEAKKSIKVMMDMIRALLPHQRILFTHHIFPYTVVHTTQWRFSPLYTRIQHHIKGEERKKRRRNRRRRRSGNPYPGAPLSLSLSAITSRGRRRLRMSSSGPGKRRTEADGHADVGKRVDLKSKELDLL